MFRFEPGEKVRYQHHNPAVDDPHNGSLVTITEEQRFAWAGFVQGEFPDGVTGAFTPEELSRV